jgi:hypothetical protein
MTSYLRLTSQKYSDALLIAISKGATEPPVLDLARCAGDP